MSVSNFNASITLPKSDTVEYRRIPGFPKYCVGDDGSVWSIHRGSWKPLKLNHDTNGYCFVALFVNGFKMQRTVHRLVLEAFAGPCPNGMEARHFPDRQPTNNRLSNLSWSTKVTNMGDQVHHGTRRRGDQAPGAKLSDERVRLIVEMLQTSRLSANEIATATGASVSAVKQIKRGTAWKHVTGGRISRQLKHRCGEDSHTAKLREAQVVEIRERVAAGERYASLAEEFSISAVSVLHIARGNRWKHAGGPLVTEPRKRGRPQTHGRYAARAE